MARVYAPNKKVGWGVYVISGFLILLYLMPIYVMLNQSFRYITDLTPRLYLPEKWTLDNYIQAFHDPNLLNGFKNSIVYVVEVCALEVFLGGLAAYGLARSGGKGVLCPAYLQHLRDDDSQFVSAGRYLLPYGEVPYDQQNMGVVPSDRCHRYGWNHVFLHLVYCVHPKRFGPGGY